MPFRAQGASVRYYEPTKIGSAYEDAALEERVQRLFVVMKPARPDGVEVPGLLGLPG